MNHPPIQSSRFKPPLIVWSKSVRASTIAIILVLIVGILDAGIGVGEFSERHPRPPLSIPHFLLVNSQACQFCYSQYLVLGSFTASESGRFPATFSGSRSGPALHPSEQYFKQRPTGCSTKMSNFDCHQNWGFREKERSQREGPCRP